MVLASFLARVGRRWARRVCAIPEAPGPNSMPDYGFGRCDGHHEMVDLRLRKKLGAGFVDSRYLSSGRSHTAVASSETTAGMSRPEVRGRLTPRFRTFQVCPKD